MAQWLRLMQDLPEIQALLKNRESGLNEQLLYGLGDAERAFLLSGLYAQGNDPMLIITVDRQQGEQLQAAMKVFLEEKVYFFPPQEVFPFEVGTQDAQTHCQRMEVLEKLLAQEKILIIAPVEALLKGLMLPDELQQFFLPLEVGQRVEQGKMIEQVVQCGYERVSLVEMSGQFAIRGGIMDLFPYDSVNPFRVEFFGDEVDSIRTFDSATQRSLEKVSQIRIPPAREMLLTEAVRNKGVQSIEQALNKIKQKISGKKSRQDFYHLRNNVAEHLEKFKEGIYFPKWEYYLPYFYPDNGLLVDYLPAASLAVFLEPARMRKRAQDIEGERQKICSTLLAEGGMLPGQVNTYVYFDTLCTKIREKHDVLWMMLLLQQVSIGKPQKTFSLSSRTMTEFHSKMTYLIEEIKYWQKQQCRIVLGAENEAQAKKLHALLRENELGAKNLEELPAAGIYIMRTNQIKGFEISQWKLVVIAAREIFGVHKQKRRRLPKKQETQLSAFTDLSIGDYVVHENHGVGKYLGISTIPVGNTQRDFLFIQYAGEDKLYVPTDQIDKIQKYIGGEEKRPKLYKLGGNEWNRIKSRAKSSVAELAKELLHLYALRQAVEGYAFPSDTSWQREFEDAFLYEETPDQAEAICDVKKDMEISQPMDRLLCGDVGYGKTEVAIRAAFKAVTASKQVAVLVPTTILAQQHYNTFRERFAEYPIVVEMISRFRSPKEQRGILKEVKRGQVDVIIGTHRLIQDDVTFFDLGLLIVDEEQRFGVSHKEKLKNLRANVDVLTLTATPIPRTLYMSLAGARDMSVIKTPPEDRYPIQTYVLEEHDELIKEAIKREVRRQGQVYFVHNRVHDIQDIAGKLSKMLPDIRIGVAHGQMQEEELEGVMLEFYDNQYDLLVCTTIIETGLDIPNVNTLIVHEADKFGLSQLYQLRGRVGRSNRIAYAYLTYKKDKVLTEAAEKRLQAIHEFTEFGSGFKIAMRDLEIRGAGNILGAQQHGHLEAIGFELYCKMLEQAVEELKGEKQEKKMTEPTIDLQIDAYIPAGYIPDEKQKIEAYKRMIAIDTLEEADDVEEELEDRYGDLPEPVIHLLTISRLRLYAKKIGLSTIMAQKNRIYLKFVSGDIRVTHTTIMDLSKAYSGKILFNAGKEPYLAINVANLSIQAILRLIQNILQKIIAVEE